MPPAALHLLPGLLEGSGGRLVDADGSRCEMPGLRVSDEHVRELPVRGPLRGRDSRVVDGGPCERMPEDDPVLDDAQETAVLGRREALRGQGVGYRGQRVRHAGARDEQRFTSIDREGLEPARERPLE